MSKARNRLLLYSVLAVFALLTVLLCIINGVNFTMAAQDADTVTEIIASQNGTFGPGYGGRQEMPEPRGRLGPMGPDSPETRSSVRYFTYAFIQGGNAGEKVSFALSAVTESEAEEWARSLLKEDTGWTRGTYRYRVYRSEGKTFVTVIDQGRELLPSYRILIISACGEVLGLLFSFLVLLYASRRLFAPLEDADRKQKEFIAGMDKEFKLPLTIVSADTELLERAGGSNDQTRSIRRQVKQMSDLLKSLGSLAVFEDSGGFRTAVPLSEFLRAEVDARAVDFEKCGLKVSTDIEQDISWNADPEAAREIISELAENSLKFSVSYAVLPKGSYDQVFDRFTTLENAGEGHEPGLGLSKVKEIARTYSGRVSARVDDGVFTLRVAL